MIPTTIVFSIGWFGWALAAHYKVHWIGPEIFYSLINFGQAVGSIAYALVSLTPAKSPVLINYVQRRVVRL